MHRAVLTAACAAGGLAVQRDHLPRPAATGSTRIQAPALRGDPGRYAPVEQVGIHALHGAADRGLARRDPCDPQPVPGPGCQVPAPFGDLGEGPRTAQRRAHRDPENDDQPMPDATGRAGIDHRREGFQQINGHTITCPNSSKIMTWLLDRGRDKRRYNCGHGTRSNDHDRPEEPS